MVVSPPSPGRTVVLAEAASVAELIEVGQDFIDAIARHNGLQAPRAAPPQPPRAPGPGGHDELRGAAFLDRSGHRVSGLAARADGNSPRDRRQRSWARHCRRLERRFSPAPTGSTSPPDGAGLPEDLARPVLAAPVATSRRCFAVVLYGGATSGTDLDHAERDLLARLAKSAEIAYAQVEDDVLRTRIAALERDLEQARSAPRVETK